MGASRVHKARPVLWVSKVLLERRVLEVSQAMPATKETLALTARLVPRVTKVSPVRGACLVSAARPVSLAKTADEVPLASPVQLVNLDLLVRPASLVTSVSLAILASRV